MKYWDEKNKKLLSEEDMKKVAVVADETPEETNGYDESANETQEETQTEPVKRSRKK